ncbi:hypothetical protein [Leptolyngbya sp. KIOST-1]|uniref:hypothetical protein n=1 Tax=Leptolyngbya sp. KIOST-1 TaxID=1229172 RepID=UPI00055CB3C5|nr:hypothetical protein [Leptolyngbya sp. KIOST-1]
MTFKQEIQKVDIDTYFSDVDDHVKVIDQPVPIPPGSSALPSLKQLLITPARAGESVLKPYRNERSMLTRDRNFSSFELETAYGAVCKLRDRLQTPAPSKAEPSPPLEVKIPNPSAANWIAPALGVSVFLGAAAVAVDTAWPSVTACWAEQCYGTWQGQLGEMVQSLPERVNASPLTPKRLPTPSADQQHFSEGLKYAKAAAELTQQAQTSQEWQQVVHLWQLAIKTIAYVPSTSPLQAKVQTKKALYLNNLDYARRELAMAPFRAGVRAAEAASKLAIEADTAADWQAAATMWQTALAEMQAVSSSNQHYAIAQAKLVEYSTKFAYAQKRYLESVAHP